jgi:lipopolysaccharide transport protein LptA
MPVKVTPLFVSCLCLFSLMATLTLAADKPDKAEPPKLTLNAKSIVFDREAGDIELTHDVVVTRTQGDEVLVVHCDHMKAKMKDGKLENAVATGNVRIDTKEAKAWAPRANFHLEKNSIHLFGDDKTLARMQSDKMESTGKQIIYHGESQKVEVIEGESKLILDSSSDKKKDSSDKKP